MSEKISTPTQEEAIKEIADTVRKWDKVCAIDREAIMGSHLTKEEAIKAIEDKIIKAGKILKEREREMVWEAFEGVVKK